MKKTTSQTNMAEMIISIILLLTITLDQTSGDVVLMVSPYPARIYENAEADVPVLKVVGYDNFTDVPVTSFSLDNGNEASYFKIDSNGIIKTSKTISFQAGRIFQFFVYPVNNQKDFKHVQIIVSKRNIYPPRFNLSSYSFSAYAFGVGDRIGDLSVIDEDVEPYNREITIFFDPRQESAMFVEVSTDGQIRLTRPVPDTITTLTLGVMAIDGGSPQLSSTANVRISVIRVRQPDTFCLSTTQNTVTLCWKNPMSGVRFEGYNFTVSGGVNSTSLLPYIEGHTESCVTVGGAMMSASYLFHVSVISRDANFSTNPMLINFDKKGIGYSSDCINAKFPVCDYRDPCSGHGNCTNSDAKNFTCACMTGWEGRACNKQNLCVLQPCQNGGTCAFKDHQSYHCSCARGYYGKNCEFFDQCLSQPCQNSGTCLTLDSGTYMCRCPPHFSGDRCQDKDPCSPSPCVAARGECVPLSESNFTCQCNRGYSGQRCQMVNACILRNQPCNYQGTCIPQGESFICLCPPGATGETCDYLDACYIEPCENNSTCTEGRLPGTYRCLCLPGFYGNECQHKNNCYGVNCNNGICEEDPVTQRPRCVCSNGFTGDKCDVVDPCSKSPCNNHGTCTTIEPDPGGAIGFNCSCVRGWAGVDCSHFNGCALHVCKNGGACTTDSLNQTRCTCLLGYYLDDCAAFDPCSGHRCQNGGRCQNVSQEDYICHCLDGWFGNFCENRYTNPCSSENSPCLNNGQCYVVEATTTETQSSTQSSVACVCQDGYLGSKCQYRDPCVSSPCVHGVCSTLDVAEADQGLDRYLCTCNDSFTGSRCDVSLCQDVSCLNSGFCTNGFCVCPPPYTGPSCEQVIQECPGRDSQDQADTPCSADETMRNLQGLLDGTSDPTKLNAAQVKNYTEQLLQLYNKTLLDPKYATSAFRVLGNLARVNISVSEEVERSENVCSRLREFLDNYTADVRLGEGGQVDIIVSELQVKVISLQAESWLTNNTMSFQPHVTDNSTDVQLNMTITIPSDVVGAESSDIRTTRLQFIGYKRSQLFVPVDGSLDSGSLWHGHPVISASVSGREVMNLTDPVQIQLFNLMPGKNYTCVFWDQEGSKWSTEGVTMLSYGTDSVTCASTHLTSFAILLDVNSDRAISQEHEQILTYLTYIGCAISTGCLVVTIITYSIFKCLNNEKSGKILLQLCAALFLLNIVFLAGTVDVSGYSDEGCLVVGVFLHYFLLASLMWMLVEAVEMYQALVTVFQKYQRLYLLKRCLLAWGIPVIVVGITAAVDSGSYYMQKKERHFCFLTSKSTAAYYTSLVAPSCLIILINSFVFIMVARVILRPNFQQQLTKDSTSVTPAQIRGAFTVMFLLGITWVFGPLAISEAQTVFSYLFCICNSLQGFLIFVFRCLFNPEAKLAWLQLFRTGTLKRRRGPIKSVYTDTTSKGGDNRRPSSSNNSGCVGTATSRTSMSKNGNAFHPHPHQLHTTNGWHPNLNGLRGDDEQIDIKDVLKSAVYLSCSDKEKSLSSEYAFPLKKESPASENLTIVDDEQTHF